MANQPKAGIAKAGYWAASFAGVALWTGGVVLFSDLPLPTQLALGVMAGMVAVWGHAVVFGKRDSDVRPASAPVEQAAFLPRGGPRRAVSGRRVGGVVAD